MTIFRKSVLFLSLLTCLGAVAQTPAWPTKSVKIVNNFPAGGPSDILARAIAEKLQSSSGQTVIVDNKPGAGGNIGATEVAKAAGDGTTVFVGIDTAFTVNPHIFPTMPFKLGGKKGDLKTLVIISSNGLLLGTSAAKGLRSMGELIAQGKSGGVNFSSAVRAVRGIWALLCCRRQVILKSHTSPTEAIRQPSWPWFQVKLMAAFCPSLACCHT